VKRQGGWLEGIKILMKREVWQFSKRNYHQSASHRNDSMFISRQPNWLLRANVLGLGFAKHKIQKRFLDNRLPILIVGINRSLSIPTTYPFANRASRLIGGKDTLARGGNRASSANELFTILVGHGIAKGFHKRDHD